MRSVKEVGLKQVNTILPTENEQSRGICEICKSFPACTYAKAVKWPVVQCEQFIPTNVIVEKITDSRRLTIGDSVTTFSPAQFRKMQRIV